MGAISGIGVISRQANTRVLRDVLASWVLTLPTAALSAGLVYGILQIVNS